MANIVFILGAGASAAGGCPVMSNFLAVAESLSWTANDECFRRSFVRVQRFRQLLMRSNAKSRIDFSNIESVFSAVDMAMALGSLANMGLDELEITRRALLYCIARTIELTQQHLLYPPSAASLPVGRSGANCYREFASLIHTLRMQPLRTHNLSIITFNYDFGLEVALATHNIPFDYALTPSVPTHALAVPVCKLHGSLNWTMHDSRADQVVVTQVSDLLSDIEIESPKYWTLSWLDHDRNKWPPDDFSRLPLIVPPTDAKSQSRKILKQVWERAGVSLREADIVYIIGYSLPDTDFFFRMFFPLCMTSDTIVRRLCIVDPSPAPDRRMRELLGPAILNQVNTYAHIQSDFNAALLSLRDQWEKSQWLI